VSSELAACSTTSTAAAQAAAAAASADVRAELLLFKAQVFGTNINSHRDETSGVVRDGLTLAALRTDMASNAEFALTLLRDFLGDGEGLAAEGCGAEEEGKGGKVRTDVERSGDGAHVPGGGSAGEEKREGDGESLGGGGRSAGTGGGGGGSGGGGRGGARGGGWGRGGGGGVGGGEGREKVVEQMFRRISVKV